jgi:glycosyltransferase involved in cell wall biosynthesis
MMRIMIVKFSPWSHSNYQKSEHPEYAAIRHLVSLNPQHHFILMGEGQRHEHFKEKGVDFYNTRSETKIDYIFSFFLKLELVLMLRPSAIAAMGTTSLIPVGISSILTRSRFISIITGEISPSMQHMPKPLERVLAFLLKIVFRKSYVILTLGQSIRNELVNDYGVDPEKILIYRYNIPQIFNPSVSKRLKSRLNPNGPIVMCISRISPEKGLHYLVEASRIVTEKLPNVKVMIKGSSGANAPLSEEKYEEKLKRLVRRYDLQEHITILGTSPYTEVPGYLSASDVFVLPSVSEGLPMVILEALATGVPIVASRVGGIPDILLDECNALLVEPRDVEGLAEAIIRMLLDDDLRRRLIERGLTTSRRMKENDIESVLTKFIFKHSNVEFH